MALGRTGRYGVAASVLLALVVAIGASAAGTRSCPVGTTIFVGGILAAKDGGCAVDSGWDGDSAHKDTRGTAFISIVAPHTITIGKPFTFTIHSKRPLCTNGLDLKELCLEQWSASIRSLDATRPTGLASASAKRTEACAGQNYGDTTTPGVTHANPGLACRAVISAATVGTGSGKWLLGATVSLFGPAGSGGFAELELPVELRKG